MKQWVVRAWDGSDEDALARRMRVREKHLEGASFLKGNDNFVLGGAMLNDAGQMIGSVMIVQFEDEAGLQAWIDREPYIQEGVWKEWEIHPFRVAMIP